MQNYFKFQIITPKKIVLQDEVESVSAPSAEGEITILFNHIPLFALLKEGVVKTKKGDRESYFSIGGGYVETTGKEVNLLVSRAYHQNEIDEDGVRRAKAEAEKLLKEGKTKGERYKAMAQLRRSLVDLKILGYKRKKRPQLH